MPLFTQINLLGNSIGGIFTNISTPEGPRAVANALRVNASLTEVDLRKNNFGVDGWCIIFDELAQSTVSKITKWTLYTTGHAGEAIGLEGAKLLAVYLATSTSVTAADLRCNGLNADAKQRLRDAVKNRASFKLDLRDYLDLVG